MSPNLTPIQSMFQKLGGFVIFTFCQKNGDFSFLYDYLTSSTLSLLMYVHRCVLQLAPNTSSRKQGFRTTVALLLYVICLI